jgi:site-specific DNA-methyltransferase (adenine-specific)
MNNWKNNSEDIYMVVKDKANYYFDVEAVKIKKKVLAPYKDKNGNNKDWEATEEGNMRMTYPSNIWFDITVPFWSMSENTDHPTQKSEKLFAKLILASSKPEDKIYEPFAGVCTAGVVANKLGRNYTCVEIEKEYCELGQYRIDKSEIDKTIQGYEGGVFRDK